MKSITLAVVLIGGLALPAATQRTPPHLPPVPPLPGPVRPGKARLARVSLEASIRDGAARTKVKALFRNPSRNDAEAEWLVPLPPGAVVHEAKLLVNGKEASAKILDAAKARAVYESIVARLMDPMLLEYAGWGLVRARIFPVPPGGKAQVTFTMTALLPEEGGKWEYTFPFKALTAGGPPPESLAAQIDIQTSKALGVVYSPTPGTEVLRKGETRALVGWESRGKRPGDLQVFFSPAEKEFGALSLFYSPKGGSGVFFLALHPRRNPGENVQVPKTLVFVVDTSGSMQGKKIRQVKKAMKFFIQSLHEGDSFNLIPFSTAARPLFSAPRAATPETRKEALDLVDRIQAEGGTNIDDALLQGLKMPPDGKKHILLFLTDGLPTLGETDPAAILRHIKEAHKDNTRIFVFGVGTDVNTFLLDRIAQVGRGDRHYVTGDEDIEVKVSSLLKKLSFPALSDLKLHMEGATLSKLTPWPLPDLFFGSTLTILGRFEGKGPHELLLQGTLQGKAKTWRYKLTLPGGPARELAWLAPLWAQRRVAHLLDQIRLFGRSKELVDEVVKLGKRYGIVTPWTSYLVAQEAQRVAQGASLDGVPLLPPAIRRDLRSLGLAPNAPMEARRGGEGPGVFTGPRAVAESKKLANLKTSDSDAEGVEKAPAGGGAGILVRRAGGKVFFFLGDTWVDREFKKEMKSRLVEVRAFSPAYFRLLREHPEAGAWLALKGKILVVIGKTPYLVR